MPLIKPSLANPHGLSTKQATVIELAVRDVQKHTPLDMAKIHKRIYNTNGTGADLARQNTNKINFRQAFLERIREEGIDKKIEGRYIEGLDAKDEKGQLDRKLILDYANSLAKIIGLNAPSKIERKSLNATVSLTSEDLQKELQLIEEELEE